MHPIIRKLVFAVVLALSVTAAGAGSAPADTIDFAIQFSAPPPPPPPPRVEVRWAAPSPHHVWIPGHWGFDKADSDWVWHSGYWEYPPVPWATWHPANGRIYHGKYYWVHGHWDY